MTDQEKSPLGAFGRYLSLWVGLSILGGILLGNLVPGLFSLIAGLDYANINLVVAVLIWVMIYPMMTQIDFASVKNIGRQPRGLFITLVINWLIKPFSMAAIGVLFFVIAKRATRKNLE